MIRVLHIIPTLGYGGVAKFVLNYYENMNKNQIIFDFVTHGSEEDFHQDLINSGSKIFYFKTIGQIGFKKYFNNLKEVITGFNSYNVVHIHEGHITGVAAFMCKKLGVKKVICHAHTTTCPNEKHKPFMPIFRFLATRYGDKLLACGKEAGKYCFGKTKFTIMHNAVDARKFYSATTEEIKRLKEIYNINDNCLVIGHIGAFINLKNHEYILDIYKMVLKEHDNCVLILVGDGILREEMYKRSVKLGISSKVIFMGIQKDIPLILNLFDVFILPSIFEGLPFVGVEAQAVGLPCYFSDSIDRTVDLGLRLVKFLPITDEYISQWAKLITENGSCKPNQEQILSKFRERGYDVGMEVEKLIKIYTE